MDYIHFKKRIIVNTQYSMMFFATNVEAETDLRVSMISLNGKYFTCVFGNELDIQATIDILATKNMSSNIVGLLDINALIKEDISSIPIKSILGSDFGILVQGDSLISKPIKTDIQTFCEIIASVYVPPPIIPFSSSIAVDFDFLVKASKKDSIPIKSIFNIDTVVNIGMVADESIGIEAEIDNTLNITIAMQNNEPIIIASSDNIGTLDVVAGLALVNSIKAKALPKFDVEITVSMDLLVRALLKDYDNGILANMDNLTLYGLSYKENEN